jgi:hypothetical protein
MLNPCFLLADKVFDFDFPFARLFVLQQQWLDPNLERFTGEVAQYLQQLVTRLGF